MANHIFDNQVYDAEQSFRATQSAATDIYKSGVDLFRRGMERRIEVLTHELNVAAEQNAEIVGMWRKASRNIPEAKPMFNMAEPMGGQLIEIERTVGQLIEAQKTTLGILGQQSTEMAESAKTQGERTARAAHEITESVTTRRELKAA